MHDICEEGEVLRKMKGSAVLVGRAEGGDVVFQLCRVALQKSPPQDGEVSGAAVRRKPEAGEQSQQ